jgi:hypothetical protein
MNKLSYINQLRLGSIVSIMHDLSHIEGVLEGF